MSFGFGLHSAIADQTYFFCRHVSVTCIPLHWQLPSVEGSCSMWFLVESVWYPLHGWSILFCAIHPCIFVQAI
jgi:hypothetical protein